jgi:hypothetical protein
LRILSEGPRSAAAFAALVAFLLLAAAPASAAPRVQVSAGGGHSCAVKLDTTIVCWGLNDHGQATAPSGTFKSVSAGSLHTCALRTDNTVACWGLNNDGEATAPSGTFASVSAGGTHTCGVRTDASVVCWGQNAGSPSYLPPAGTFASVSEGDSSGSPFACGVRTTQVLACWGYNAYGRASPPAGTFATIDAGGAHTCGVRTDGTIACWGFGTDGQPLAVPPTGTFGALSSGYDHTCAIRSDSSLACWGRDANGQIAPPPGTFTALSLGSFHGCAIAGNGAVVCWGANNSGQVGPLPLAVTQPIGAVAPATLVFAPQPRGSLSAPRQVTVTNNGAADLQVVGESFTGPAADDFFVGASTCRGPLPGGTSCSVWVRFAPQGAGNRTATLVLDTNATPASYTVALSGTTPVVVTCTVPRLAGKTLAAAKAALATAHCALGRVTRAYSAKVRKGRVIKSSPAAARVLGNGAKVNIVLSRGKRP